MDRVGYFNQKLMQSDAKRIMDLVEHIDQHHAGPLLDGRDVVAMATAIYTTRMLVEHPDFNDTEVKQ